MSLNVADYRSCRARGVHAANETDVVAVENHGRGTKLDS